MTPFDVTYAHEFLIQQEFASAPQHQTASAPVPRPARAGTLRDGSNPAAASSVAPRGYPLLENSSKGLAVPSQTEPRPRSMQTPSYTEFVLQVLDRDSIMTSLVFIGFYIGLIQSL